MGIERTGLPNQSDESPLYRTPIVGDYLREARQFYDEMRPTPDDSPGVAFGKNVIRYGTVAAAGATATAVAAVVCL